MIETYGIYVVAHRRFTRSNIVCGVFPNEKSAMWFRDAFCSTAKIYCLPKSAIYFGDYGIEMREGFNPIS